MVPAAPGGAEVTGSAHDADPQRSPHGAAHDVGDGPADAAAVVPLARDAEGRPGYTELEGTVLLPYAPRPRPSLRLRLRRKILRFARSWRESLSARVVAATVVGGLTLLLLLGGVLAAQIRGGLYDERVTQMLQDAALRAQDAQVTFESTTASTSQDVQSVANDWTLRSAATGVVGTVLMRSPTSASSVTINDPATNTALRDLVSPQMRAAVASEGGQHWQAISLDTPDGDAPGIVVGSPVTLPAAGPYELYQFYSLAAEEGTISLVLRILAVGAATLVVLLGGMTWLITRWVLRPVQDAAFTAERIASGLLDERMDVRGHDELALLGESFNEMAASLQSQIERLAELSRLQQRFVSDVSHELRTPLTTIRIAGELIHDAKDSFDPPVRRSAELLHAQLDRFESMLADLLEISRFDAGAAILDIEQRDVRDLVDRVVDGSAILAERKGTEIRVHAPDEPCTADVDARRIERVLRNLLANAVEHGEGRPIDITVGVDDAAVGVRVLDHGVGMSDEAAAHVFDRFWRADPARARTTGGTGLGLSISMEDARLHGGTLEAAGAPGVGASFLLTLPRHAGAVVTVPPVPLRPDPPGGVDAGAPEGAGFAPDAPHAGAGTAPDAVTASRPGPVPGHARTGKEPS